MFAATTLPKETPKLWEIVTAFAKKDTLTESGLTPEKARTLFENLQYMEADSLHSNEQLLSELHSFVGPKGVSLGIVLISPSQTCKLCGSSLMVKADRPSRVTVYTDTIGTTEGTHYRKICKKYKSGCPFVQHYGHYSTGGTNIYFSEDWESLPYFISTRETAVQMSLLQQLDAEILIGQLSYKQRAEIYNYKHGHDKATKKIRSKAETESKEPQYHLTNVFLLQDSEHHSVTKFITYYTELSVIWAYP